jgi:crossover junction endodeoxyribonuclease RusA
VETCFEVEGAIKTAGSKSAFPLTRKDNICRKCAEVVPDKSWRTCPNEKCGINLPMVSIRMVEDAKGAKGWKDYVAQVGNLYWPGQPSYLPFEVWFDFHMPRFKSHYGTGRNSNRVKDSADRFHVQKPDVLKMARAIEDALIGVVWARDEQIVKEHLSKIWVPQDQEMRVVITARELDTPHRVHEFVEKRAERLPRKVKAPF